MNKKNIVIALAGNPNSGKTTIFNSLTGAHQHVGNYPGVTVERKEGRVKYKDYDISVIDLPGTYGLSAYSPDEVVARQVIIEEKLDIVVNVVDASNLERNLYLTTQLEELEVPLILVLNMADVAEKNEIKINYDLLSQLLGIPVIRTVGSQNEGVKEILNAVVNTNSGQQDVRERQVCYRLEIENELARLQKHLPGPEPLGQEIAAATDFKNLIHSLSSRWLIIKLLENDLEISTKVSALKGSQVFMDEVVQSRCQIKNLTGDDPEMVLVEDRYAYIRGICYEVIHRSTLNKVTLTEKIDNILLNRILGIPFFLGLMWLLFQLTFTLAAPAMDWIDTGFSLFGNWLNAQITDELLRSLLVMVL